MSDKPFLPSPLYSVDVRPDPDGKAQIVTVTLYLNKSKIQQLAERLVEDGWTIEELERYLETQRYFNSFDYDW